MYKDIISANKEEAEAGYQEALDEWDITKG